MKFKDLKFRTWGKDDLQARVEINGYDVSIVRNSLSYGGDKGLYEIGVFKNDKMCDPLGWGDDVLGWLTPQCVQRQLQLLEAL